MRLPARTWAVVYVVLTMGFPGFGLPDLAVSVDPNRGADFEGYQVLEGFWGLFFTVLVGVPFVSMAWRPHRSAPAMWQVLVSSAALAVAAVAGAEVGAAVWAAVLALGVALVAGQTPDREPLHSRLGPVSRTAAALALLGAAPWLWYAVDMLRAARERRPEDDIGAGLHHYPVLGAAAVALVALSVLVAIWPRGRVFVGLCIALVAVWFGVTTLAFPDVYATPAAFWAAAATLWGAGIACISVVEFLRAKQAQIS